MSTPGGPDRDPYAPRTPEDAGHGDPRTPETAAYGAVPPAPPAWPVAPPSWPATGPHPAPPAYGAGAPGYGPPTAVPPGWSVPSAPPAPRGASGLVAAGLFTTAAAVFLLALAVGSLVLLLGVGGAALGAGLDFEDYEGGTETGQAYGDNDYLDGLWDDCEAGDGFACDELSWSSEYGSDYERFGSTCGDRLDDDAYAPMTCDDVVG